MTWQLRRSAHRPLGQPGTVLTIGNFDGLHLGHQALVNRVMALAQARGLPAGLMTFEPLPRAFFRPHQAPARVMPLRDKLSALRNYPLDVVVVRRFNQALAALSAAAFVQRILVSELRVSHIVVGDDFRFGAGRHGDVVLLQELGQQYGFTAETVATVCQDGRRVSSSWLREALLDGDFDRAQRLLGRPYCLSGRVRRGRELGRTLGYPTANLSMRCWPVPLNGVYAVTVVGIGNTPMRGVAHIGTNPTVGGVPRVLEVYIFDFDGDLYDQALTVRFHCFIRAEQQFETLPIMQDAMAEDVAQAKRFFENEYEQR